MSGAASLRVSLMPRGARAADGPAPPLLSRPGADLILGAAPDEDFLPEPVAADEATLFAPRGAFLAAEDGPLFVSDTGHHRLLIWDRLPTADEAPADRVLGQDDFHGEARNQGGEPSAYGLNVPTGVAFGGGVLAVCDAWNHRVLLWAGLPETGRPADLVLGQEDFEAGSPNRGGDVARADTLHWPYGVAIDGGRLFVCDTGNRRVLVWASLPTRDGQPADLVLGQADFDCRDENGGRAADAGGMRWPHALVLGPDGALFVADAGDNRVMGWRSLPSRNGQPCDFVLGQADAGGVDHNRAAYRPSALSLNMPYGLALHGGRLVVADTANSRLLGYAPQDWVTGGQASALAGQDGFDQKGDNRWRAAARDSLCWPYAVTACGSRLVVADSGNNRVLVWRSP